MNAIIMNKIRKSLQMFWQNGVIIHHMLPILVIFVVCYGNQAANKSCTLSKGRSDRKMIGKRSKLRMAKKLWFYFTN